MRVRVAVVGALAVAVLTSAAPASAAPITAADRREINSVVDRFVVAAVKRQHPLDAWSLATPTLRAGTTRRDWARGDVPTYPYPAKGSSFHNWQVAWSGRNDLGINLTLMPVRRERKKLGAIAFGLELKRIRGHWLVDGFYPEANFAPVGSRPAVTSAPDFTNSGADTSPALLGGVWWIVVIGVLGLAPLVAIAAGIVLLVRRRAGRDAVRIERGNLPPLPARIRERTTVGK
jgi:hypothetical protein